MKLYYVPGVCSFASHIALLEAKIPFTLDKMDRITKIMESGENYLQVNPKGSVPALRLDNGEILTEGPVILQYIADLDPQSQLAPPVASFERYRLMEWLNYIGTEVHKQYSPMFNPAFPAPCREYQRNVLAEKFQFLSHALSAKTFLLGETFSIADAYLFVVLRWSPRFEIDLAQWPVLAGYIERITARPAVQTALRAEGLLN